MKIIKPRDIGLDSDSFVGLNGDEPDRRRVIAMVEAAQKVGKTDFCIRDTPDPIVVFNFDQGLEGMVEKFVRKGKKIIVAGLPGSNKKSRYPSYHFARPVPQRKENRRSGAYVERVKALANPIWERFITDLSEFYKSDARTGVIDTSKACYTLGKFAYMGMDRTNSKDDPYGQKTGILNAIFQGLITDGQNYDKNVLWVSRLKEEWKGGEPTGNQKSDCGYNQLGYEAMLTIRLTKKKQKVAGSREWEHVRQAEVRDCRMDEEMNGEVFKGSMVKFASIMALVTGTEEEVWR